MVLATANGSHSKRGVTVYWLPAFARVTRIRAMPRDVSAIDCSRVVPDVLTRAVAYNLVSWLYGNGAQVSVLFLQAHMYYYNIFYILVNIRHSRIRYNEYMAKGLLLPPVIQHAYVVTGSAAEGAAHVISVLKERQISISGNLDALVLRYKDMAVDDVRDTIIPFASLKSLSGAKYCIVSFDTANGNAQNALLKIVEEAPGDTHFFFCVDLLGSILPTLRSRCIVLSLVGVREQMSDTDDATEFLEETFAKRLARVESMAASVSKTQDRTAVRVFVRSLLSVAHARSYPSSALRDLLDADRFMRLSGSSPKAILGHLAVSLPRHD